MRQVRCQQPRPPDLPVPSSVNGAGIPLSQLAEVTPTWAVSQINRNQLTRTVPVSGYTQGRLPSEVVKDLQKSLQSYPLPQGYRIEYGGEQEEGNKSFADLGRLSLMVMVLIYLLLDNFLAQRRDRREQAPDTFF